MKTTVLISFTFTEARNRKMNKVLSNTRYCSVYHLLDEILDDYGWDQIGAHLYTKDFTDDSKIKFVSNQIATILFLCGMEDSSFDIIVCDELKMHEVKLNQEFQNVKD